MTCTILEDDCREMLRTLPDESVHCVVTSPPYWALRDYGFEGQIGLEPTVEEWVATIVEVFREVRRVLRRDGVCWVNLGDSYATGNCGGGSVFDNGRTDGRKFYEGEKPGGREATKTRSIPSGLKPKDLVGQPWRVAFALQKDGWYIRSDCIWHKPNPMPESVTDRPTKSHEYVFLLTKSERYFYDANAVRESAEYGRCSNFRGGGGYIEQDKHHWNGQRNVESSTTFGINPASGRNLRTVWTIPTEAVRDAHFATFPRKLARTCVLAGTSKHGCCFSCGAPWERSFDRIGEGLRREVDRGFPGAPQASGGSSWRPVEYEQTGWRPTCSCPPADPVPCVVLDPFGGTGTVAIVAHEAGCHSIMIEANLKYVEIMRKRTRKITSQRSLFADV